MKKIIFLTLIAQLSFVGIFALWSQDRENMERELMQRYEEQYKEQAAKDKADFPLHNCNKNSEFGNIFNSLSLAERAAAVVRLDNYGNNLFHTFLIQSSDKNHSIAKQCFDVLSVDDRRNTLLQKINMETRQ
ncbi:hypothetical protein JST56_04580 [Candidatus Dependentiae bacterium]|nr:hypothetical protein [Candidatus Dependentiae bacterium]